MPTSIDAGATRLLFAADAFHYAQDCGIERIDHQVNASANRIANSVIDAGARERMNAD
jgi:hypothetical protein